MHKPVTPSILYFGTPVVLIGTLNEDATYNLAPFSSVFWLGWRSVLGVASSSKTAQNIVRTGECALNLPSAEQAAAVNRLALTTGVIPVPDRKRQRGYVHVPDKFGAAGLTPSAAQTVAAPLVRECPVQMEGVAEATHGIADDDPEQRGNLLCIEIRVQRVRVEESLLMQGEPNRIDPDKWRPLIMSFQKFYGLGPQVHESRLATIAESAYRTPDVERGFDWGR